VLAFIFSALLFHDPYSDLNTNAPNYDGIFSLLLPIYTVAKRCAPIVAVFLNGLPEISTLCSWYFTRLSNVINHRTQEHCMHLLIETVNIFPTCFNKQLPTYLFYKTVKINNLLTW